MRLKVIKISFVASIIIMVISVGLFYNLGVYVDEAGTIPSVVNGGMFWLYMDWLRLLISFLLVVVLGMTVVYMKPKKSKI